MNAPLTEASAARHLGIPRKKLRELRSSHLKLGDHYTRAGGVVLISAPGLEVLGKAIGATLSEAPRETAPDTLREKKTAGAGLARALEASVRPVLHKAGVTRTWGPARIWIEARLESRLPPAACPPPASSRAAPAAHAPAPGDGGEKDRVVRVRVRDSSFFGQGMPIEVLEDNGQFFFHGRAPTKKWRRR